MANINRTTRPFFTRFEKTLRQIHKAYHVIFLLTRCKYFTRSYTPELFTFRIKKLLQRVEL